MDGCTHGEGMMMEVDLYYVIRRYTHTGKELEKPVYKAGPFPNFETAVDAKLDIEHNTEYYDVCHQTVTMKEW